MLVCEAQRVTGDSERIVFNILTKMTKQPA